MNRDFYKKIKEIKIKELMTNKEIFRMIKDTVLQMTNICQADLTLEKPCPDLKTVTTVDMNQWIDSKGMKVVLQEWCPTDSKNSKETKI